MQWQPIETAPQDGTPILVWIEKPRFGSSVQPASFSPNRKLVGNVFHFDMPKATHWIPQLDGPGD